MEDVQILSSKRTWDFLSPATLFRSRNVVWFFILQDTVVRYKQTLMGVLWVLLQPLIEMIIFTAIFARTFSQTESPYPIFVFSGLIIWTYLASALPRITTCFVSSANLLKKIAIPKLVIPLSVCVSRGIDLFLSLIALVVLLFAFNVPVTVQLFWIVPLTLHLLLLTLGIGLLLSLTHVYYRDVGLLIPYLLRLLLFCTPVIYPLSSLPQTMQSIVSLNPLTAIVLAMQSITAGNAPVFDALYSTSLVVTVIVLALALLFFYRFQGTLLDEL